MIRDRHKKIAEDLGIAATKSKYEFFQNNEYRGANFKWEHFVRLVYRTSFLFLYFRLSVWERFTKKDIKELELIKYKAIVKTFEGLKNEIS